MYAGPVIGKQFFEQYFELAVNSSGTPSEHGTFARNLVVRSLQNPADIPKSSHMSLPIPKCQHALKGSGDRCEAFNPKQPDVRTYVDGPK